jgi:lipooligosaccharide transport system permease protein
MSSLFIHVIERDMLAYRRQWVIFLTGFVEPLLYLLSIGVGVGALVGSVHVGGQTVDYDKFVAPGLLAVAAMNGSVFDTTFNFFFKFKYARSFDAMLATPLRATDVALGELSWALLRGSIYAAAFLVTMALLGLVASPWGILCLPAAMLIGFAFAGAGMAATTFMRSFVDFDYVNLALIPLFLFSATFFPVDALPPVARWVVEVTPLYRGVVLCRELTTGAVSWASLVSVVYLAAMGVIGLLVARRRLDKLLLT